MNAMPTPSASLPRHRTWAPIIVVVAIVLSVVVLVATRPSGNADRAPMVMPQPPRLELPATGPADEPMPAPNPAPNPAPPPNLR